MEKHKWLNRLVWAMVVILLATSGITIYLLLEQKAALGKTIESAVQQHLNNAMPKDGYTPIKGKDYFDGVSVTPSQIQQSVDRWLADNPPKDGKDGSNGSDGKDGKSVTDEQIESSVEKYMKDNPPQLSLTPIIRCNEEKNRWEVKYGQEDTWQLLGGTRIVCTVELKR